MLNCATVLIFGCSMVSSACQISISGYKGELGSDPRLEQKILKIEYTLKTTLKRHEELLNQILEKKYNDLVPANIRLEDVSYKKMTGQSSSHSGHGPSGSAVDGDLSTMFHTNNEKTPYWWVDLGGSFSVQHVEIWNRAHNYGRRLHDLDIMIGPTLREMKPCTYYKGPASNGEHLILNCRKTTKGRYVKLALRGREWLHLREVKVFAYVKAC
ncbi:fucolectin-6-like [Mytilus californianus]|uniref:fucolectin-6-like n=1 Tax=Mytilus californianus TaxID=6549 RepID=UPI00224776A8|nr:fucolectin-6-like [Mytilus californianus]XP_052086088.1 fucolectin-6-like [Mytilus californianus]